MNRFEAYASSQGREYMMPEDITLAFMADNDINEIRLEVLEMIGNKQAEDPCLCAFIAWKGPAS